MKRNDKKSTSTRREFLASTSIIATGPALGPEMFTAIPVKYPLGWKSEKIRLGFIKIGNRGSQLLHVFMANELLSYRYRDKWDLL